MSEHSHRRRRSHYAAAALIVATLGSTTRRAVAQHAAPSAAQGVVRDASRGAADRPRHAGAALGPARTGDADLARTFELGAREGLARQLDDGYRRHLDWHRAAGDRWAWYLWQVIDGERAGLYVDGTVGHPWADFDAAVDPPGDAADNAVNVDPFATRAANHVWRLRPELGGTPIDPEAAPLVLRTEYRVRVDAQAAFDRALRRLRAVTGERPYAVYELLSGGEPPTYVVWAPAATWADAGAFADRAADVTRGLSASAERVRAELWRFRPDLSLCRSAATRCHATLSQAPPQAGTSPSARPDR